MNKYLISLTMTLLFVTCLLVCFILSGITREMEEQVIDRYYTSIQIEKGDSLWSIAGKYGKNSGMTTSQYIKELKSMNGLKEDTIHSGQYLTVMYVVPDSD